MHPKFKCIWLVTDHFRHMHLVNTAWPYAFGFPVCIKSICTWEFRFAQMHLGSVSAMTPICIWRWWGQSQLSQSIVTLQSLPCCNRSLHIPPSWIPLPWFASSCDKGGQLQWFYRDGAGLAAQLKINIITIGLICLGYLKWYPIWEQKKVQNITY